MPSSQPSREPTWLWGGAALTAALICAIVIWELSGAEYFANDTAQYLSVADNLRESGRLVTTIAIYEAQHYQGFPSAQTIWPFGYPILIAIVATILNIDAVESIRLLNAVSHGLSVIVLFATVRRLACPPIIALALATAWAVHFVPLNLGIAGTSEAVYVLLIVLVLFAYSHSIGSARKLSWLVASGAALAGAYSIRYQAIAYGPALFAAILFELRRTGCSWRRAILKAAFCVAPFAGVFLAITARNIILSGTVSGLWLPPPSPNLEPAIDQLVWALGYLAWPLPGGVKQALTESRGLAALALVLGLLVILGLSGTVQRVLYCGWKGDAHETGRLGVSLLALSGIAITLGLLISLMFRTSAATFEPRYFAVLIPSLFVALGALFGQNAALLPTLMVPSTETLTRNLFAIGVAGLVLVSASQWPARLAPQSDTQQVRRILKEARLGNESLASFLHRETSDKAPVLSNQAQLAYFVTRKPAIGIPIRRLSLKNWSPQDILELAERFGARYAVVFRNSGAGEPEENDYLSLAVKENPPWLVPLLSTNTVLLFRIEHRPN